MSPKLLSNTIAVVLTLVSASTAIPSVAINSGLNSCLSGGGVSYIDSSSSNWAGQLGDLTYNTRLPISPIAIAKPTTTGQVAAAIVCASKAGVKVQARSGGHSYANYGLGGQNGSMVVDLSSFQQYSFDKSSGRAVVGAGMKLGTMAQLLNNDGRALPHGTCAGVGIGGHATHGGYGYTSRAWGITLDHVLAVNVVLANGSYIHASTTQNSELFFALRGAADYFGIITDFTFATVSAPKTVFNFFYDFPQYQNSVSDSTTALLHLQDFARNSSQINSKLSFGVFISNSVWSVRGQYLGTEAEFKPMKDQMFKHFTKAQPTTSSTGDKTWLQSLIIMNDGQTADPPAVEHDNFFAKSVVVPESSPLTSTAVSNYFGYLYSATAKSSAAGNWFSIINLYGGAGSAINTVSATAAAYPDRTALWVFQHYSSNGGNAGFPRSMVDFVNGMNDAVESKMPGTAFTAYLNYLDPSLTPQQKHDLYYGQTLYSKLTGLKKKYDAKNVFYNPLWRTS